MELIEEDRQYVAATALRLGLKNKVFLITGATGMIGRNLVFALERITKKQNIIVLGKDFDDCRNVFDGHDFIYSSFSTLNKLSKKVDFIIHLASPTNSSYLKNNPVETIDFIYSSTKKMLDFADKNHAKILFVSSMEVYGEIKDDFERKENQLGYLSLESTRNSYPETKRLCELLCFSYAKEFNTDVCSARLAQTFGAGTPLNDPRIFGYIARCVNNKEDIVLKTEGHSIGNYCYLSDTIAALLFILAKGVRGETYNVVGDDNRSSIFDMATLVAKNISKNKIKVVVKTDPSNPYPIETKLRMSNDKIKDLGWKPKYNLLEMFERMVGDL